MTAVRSVARGFAGAALAAALTACGGTDIVPPPPTPPPTPPPPRVVAEQRGLGVAVGYAYGVYFDTTGTGTIDATVDYTHGDSLVLVWIAKGRCTAEQFEAEQCPYVATSMYGPKPRKVSATGQAAGSYTLIMASLGPKDESLSYQVVFTQTVAGGSVGASARRPAEPAFRVPVPAHAREQ